MLSRDFSLQGVAPLGKPILPIWLVNSGQYFGESRTTRNMANDPRVWTWFVEVDSRWFSGRLCPIVRTHLVEKSRTADAVRAFARVFPRICAGLSLPLRQMLGGAAVENDF